MVTACSVFGVSVTLVTSIWVYALRKRPFEFLAYAMFLPGAMAVAWSALQGNGGHFLWTLIGLDQVVRLYFYVSIHCYCVVFVQVWLSKQKQ